jgi:group I intron endonuclease
MAYVYRHIRKDKDQVFYIGIGTDDKGNRRAKSKNSRNKIWNTIINKTEYEVEIIFEDVDLCFAIKKEIEFIKLYGKIIDGTGTLCNLTDGGEGALGFKHTKEFKKKLSNKRKGENNHMFGRKGELNPNYGKKHSEERKRKNSESKKGMFEKEKNPFYGKKHTDEDRKKMSEIQKVIAKRGSNNHMSAKVIDCNNGKIYNCIREAAESFGFTYSKTKCLLNGKTKTNNTGLMFYREYIKKEGN